VVAGCGKGASVASRGLGGEVLRFGRAHENTLARGVGVSRKSKLIRIKGLAGRCCYGGCCRPSEEEETRGASSGEEEPRRERNGGNPS